MTEAELQYEKAEYLRIIRQKTGLSRPEFARRAGISVNTITNWETGNSVPNEAQLRSWFRAAGVDEAAALVNYAFIGRQQTDPKADKLALYIKLIKDPEILECLSFLLLQDHGSDTKSVLMEVAANLRCPMIDRVGVVGQICSIFHIRAARGELLPGPNVDWELLGRSASKGTAAAIAGENNYTK